MVLLMATWETARTGDEHAELALRACLDPKFERRCNHFTRERLDCVDVVDEACDLSFLQTLAVKHPPVKHMATVSGEACAAIVERGGSLEAACCMMDFSTHVPAWYRRSRIRVARRARVRLRPARTVRLRAGAASQWKTTRPDGTRSRSTAASSAKNTRARPRTL